MNAVEVSGAYKVFSAQVPGGSPVVALNGVSLSVRSGSITVIGGANGSGKSVLMKIIAGLMPLSDGRCVTSSKPGLIFQDAASQILGDTPREDVAVGPRNQKMSRKDIPGAVERALGSVGLLQKADWPALLLSGGEKRRLAVAAILAMQKDILIFDEPYANLDFPGVCSVNALIEELHGSGRTVIILTHEIEKCLALSDHFVILSAGNIVFDGEPGEALERDLEAWGIRNPLAQYASLSDLVWRTKKQGDFHAV